MASTTKITAGMDPESAVDIACHPGAGPQPYHDGARARANLTDAYLPAERRPREVRRVARAYGVTELEIDALIASARAT